MLCLALLCLAVLSSDFALILRLACLRLSLSRIGQKMREIHMILQQFSPDRKLIRKMLFSAPFLGRTTAEPQKWKITKSRKQDFQFCDFGTFQEIRLPRSPANSFFSENREKAENPVSRGLPRSRIFGKSSKTGNSGLPRSPARPKNQKSEEIGKSCKNNRSFGFSSFW